MPVVHVIAVWRLDEDCAVTQTLGENLTADVVESDTMAYIAEEKKESPLAQQKQKTTPCR